MALRLSANVDNLGFMKRKREAELVLKKKEEEAEEIKKERWYAQTGDDSTKTVATLSESEVFGLERLSRGRRSFGNFNIKKEPTTTTTAPATPIDQPQQPTSSSFLKIENQASTEQDTKPPPLTSPDQFLEGLKGFLNTDNFYNRKKPKQNKDRDYYEDKEGKEEKEGKKIKKSKKNKNKNKHKDGGEGKTRV